jgi:hypothetical protein
MDFIQEKIKELKDRKRQLAEELKRIDAGLTGLEKAPGLMSLENGLDVSGTLIEKETYSKMQIQESIVHFLKSVATEKTTRGIMEGILAGGFATDAKNKFSLVYSALTRLEKKEVVRKTKTGWIMGDKLL